MRNSSNVSLCCHFFAKIFDGISSLSSLHPLSYSSPRNVCFFPLCKWSLALCYCPSMSSFPFVSWWGWALKHNVQKVKVTVVLRKWAFVFWNVHLWYYQTIIIVNLTIKYMLHPLHFSSMNRYMYQIVIQIYWQNTIFLYSFMWNCRTSCMLSVWMFDCFIICFTFYIVIVVIPGIKEIICLSKVSRSYKDRALLGCCILLQVC